MELSAPQPAFRTMLRWVKKTSRFTDLTQITEWILPFNGPGHWATLVVNTDKRSLTVVDHMHITGTDDQHGTLQRVIDFVRHARGNAAIIIQPRVCILLRRYTQTKINGSV